MALNSARCYSYRGLSSRVRVCLAIFIPFLFILCYATGAHAADLVCTDCHRAAHEPACGTCSVNCHTDKPNNIRHNKGLGTPLDVQDITDACVTCHVEPEAKHPFVINVDPNTIIAGQRDLDGACGQCHGCSDGPTAVINNAPYFSKEDIAQYARAMHSGNAGTPTAPLLPPYDPGSHIDPSASGILSISPVENAPSELCYSATGPCFGKTSTIFKLVDVSTPAGVNVYVDWGDGTPAEAGVQGGSFTHRYGWMGTFTIILTASDVWGFTDQKSYVATVQENTGKGTLSLQASGSFGNALNGAPLGITYYVYDSSGMTIITSGSLIPSTGSSENFKDLLLDAGSYTVKLLFPPTAIGATTYHYCINGAGTTAFNGAQTMSTGAQQLVSLTSGDRVVLSGEDCQ